MLTFAGPEHSFLGSGTLNALKLFPLFVLEAVENFVVELVSTELARARLARVCLQVTGVKPLCTACLAN